MENVEAELLWDFIIRTDSAIEERRPDVVVVDKKNCESIIIDVAVPGDFGVVEKENDKVINWR